MAWRKIVRSGHLWRIVLQKLLYEEVSKIVAAEVPFAAFLLVLELYTGAQRKRF